MIIFEVFSKKSEDESRRTQTGAALSEGLKDAVLMLPNYNVEKLRQVQQYLEGNKNVEIPPELRRWLDKLDQTENDMAKWFVDELIKRGCNFLVIEQDLFKKIFEQKDEHLKQKWILLAREIAKDLKENKYKDIICEFLKDKGIREKNLIKTYKNFMKRLALLHPLLGILSSKRISHSNAKDISDNVEKIKSLGELGKLKKFLPPQVAGKLETFISSSLEEQIEYLQKNPEFAKALALAILNYKLDNLAKETNNFISEVKSMNPPESVQQAINLLQTQVQVLQDWMRNQLIELLRSEEGDTSYNNTSYDENSEGREGDIVNVSIVQLVENHIDKIEKGKMEKVATETKKVFMAIDYEVKRGTLSPTQGQEYKRSILKKLVFRKV